MNTHVTDHVILRCAVDWPDVVRSGWVVEAIVVSCNVDVGSDVVPSVVGP